MGFAMYKGRWYRVEYIGPTRYGRRAKLAYLNGSKVFWVSAGAIGNVFPSIPNPTVVPAGHIVRGDGRVVRVTVPDDEPESRDGEFDDRRAEKAEYARLEAEAERAAYEDEMRAEIEAGGDYESGV